MSLPSPFELERFVRALNFAAVRHQRQRRKGRGGAPYVNHLIEVTLLLVEHGVTDEDTLCAAVLHDTVEDASVAIAELRHRFGPVVADTVRLLTDDPDVSRWEARSAQVSEACSLTIGAQNVRVADKISNLRAIITSPPPTWSVEWKLAYYEWARMVVGECTEANEALRQTFCAVHREGMKTLELIQRSR